MDDYHYLCYNCGFITPFEKWFLWHWDDEGNVEVPAEPGYQDPIERCPVCRCDHTDGNYSPGIMGGTLMTLTVERQREQEEWGECWAEVEKEVFGL